MLDQGLIGFISGFVGGNGAMYVGTELVEEIAKRNLVKYGIGFTQRVFTPIMRASFFNFVSSLLGNRSK